MLKGGFVEAAIIDDGGISKGEVKIALNKPLIKGNF